ncbi:hypothetical protein ACSVHC_08850 [Arthrobacter sp. KNU-44]|uniref:hypothetical protein n=1 Tax=Arthrobacter sp. KNU-44 TaxID=3450744 RepID=UPI003F423F2A
MDLICGDTLGITCGTWVQLWSGAIGAFVAAVIGGIVALMVVRMTNAHQRKMASHGRVLGAIADFNAAISALPRRFQDGLEVIQSLVMQADAAGDRMLMEMDDLKLAYELSMWGLDLGGLAAKAIEFRDAGDLAKYGQAYALLRDASRFVTSRTRYWGRIPRRVRLTWAAELESERNNIVVQRERLSK